MVVSMATWDGFTGRHQQSARLPTQSRVRIHLIITFSTLQDTQHNRASTRTAPWYTSLEVSEQVYQI